MKFKLIEPTTLNECIPIVKDITMGDVEDQVYFLGSLAGYVGVIPQRRDYVKGIWKLKFAYFEDDLSTPIGTTGWYKWPPLDSEGCIWLSWFGIRKPYERKGYGSVLLQQTIDEIKNEHKDKYRWLYVFTDNADKFYQSCGLERLGSIKELIDKKFPGINEDTGFNLDEIVLRKQL